MLVRMVLKHYSNATKMATERNMRSTVAVLQLVSIKDLFEHFHCLLPLLAHSFILPLPRIFIVSHPFACDPLSYMCSPSIMCFPQTEDYLKRKIRSRPERSELVRMHILEGEFLNYMWNCTFRLIIIPLVISKV